MKKFFLSAMLFVASASTATLFGQTMSVKQGNDLNIINVFSANEKTADDSWAMYSDEENHKYYIDFQKINVNLNDIHVKNEKGEEVFKDNLFTLPVDTIYELDLSVYPAGKYEIELRTFTQSLKRTMTVK